jgi:hypothetical protein
VAARFLLDTNICIDIWRRRLPAVLERFSPADAGGGRTFGHTYANSSTARSKANSGNKPSGNWPN